MYIIIVAASRSPIMGQDPIALGAVQTQYKRSALYPNKFTIQLWDKRQQMETVR